MTGTWGGAAVVATEVVVVDAGNAATAAGSSAGGVGGAGRGDEGDGNLGHFLLDPDGICNRIWIVRRVPHKMVLGSLSSTAFPGEKKLERKDPGIPLTWLTG